MAGHFPTLLRTTCDFSVYQEVLTQRARRTVAYFALLLVLSSLVIATACMLQLRSWIHANVIPELDKLPTITIKDHQASADVPQPWRKSFEDAGSGMKTVFIIDTTGHTKGLLPDEQGFLLTRTHLHMKDPRRPALDPFELTHIDDVVISPTTVAEQFIPLALRLTFLVCALGLPVYFAVVKLVHALIFTLVGLIAGSGKRRRLTFGDLFTISLYALTPAILVDVLRSVVGLEIPYFWLLYLAIGGIYTAFAVRGLPEPIEPLHMSSPFPPIGGPPSMPPTQNL